MNGIDEGRKNIEKINFAVQGMAESGSFWNPYLVFYDAYGKPFRVRRRLMDNDLWYNITVAYWALVLFGFQSYLSRRLFEGLIGYYQGTIRKAHTKNGMRILSK